MLVIPPSEFRKHRRPRKQRASAPTPTALNLVVAVLESFDDDPRVRLTFDRAIDLAGFDPSHVRVDDPTNSGSAFVGTGVDDVPDAQSVVVGLVFDGPAEGSQTVLNATAETGIVAADDGTPWGGASELPLPFP